MALMIGLMAMRTGYLNRMRRSATPLARAVITYWRDSSSDSELRRMRISPAVPAVPITISGTGKCFIRSQTRARLHGAARNSGENRPPGLHPNSRRVTNIRISASRKFGVARPMNPNTVPA